MDPDDGLSDDLFALGEPRRAAAASGSDLAAAAAIETAGPAIEIDRLATRSGGALVLEDITLTVRRQEIFGLLGPNGAGKTSLLKSILAAGARARRQHPPVRSSRTTRPARAPGSPTCRRASSRPVI